MAAVKTIKLISWHDDVRKKAAALTRSNICVDAAALLKTSSVVGEMARLNPAVLVLDLDKVPSRSREIAIALRTSKAARHIPILFAGGEQEKIERIRAEIPDVNFAEWENAPRAVAELLKRPVEMHAAIAHRDYSATSLPKKLGVRAHIQLALIGAPDGFEEMLGDLPEGTSLATRLTAKTDLALCFVRSAAELDRALDMLVSRLPATASVWIVYPKRASRHATDLNENIVRDAALAAGLVDYKVCSVDSAWSALKFAHRRKA
jgi:hypothetical protein